MKIFKSTKKRKPNLVKGKSSILKTFIVLTILGAASFCLAFSWQNAQESLIDTTASTPIVEQIPAESSTNTSVLPQSSSSESSSATEQASSTPNSQPESASTGNTEQPASVAVAKSDPVLNSYFEDAIFFGDSISTGIPLYKIAGNPNTMAFTGINPDSINTAQVIVTPEGKKTLLEAAAKYGDKQKVYIMLGANGLGMDEVSFANGYQKFISSVKAQYPNAVIYLQSILPVTVDAYKEYPTAKNDVIQGFNKQIIALAKSNNIHYLDIYQEMADSNGDLPTQASPQDGMHLTPEYYNIWFDYLKTHTVEVK